MSSMCKFIAEKVVLCQIVLYIKVYTTFNTLNSKFLVVQFINDVIIILCDYNSIHIMYLLPKCKNYIGIYITVTVL